MREEIRKSIIDNGNRLDPSADPARTDAHGGRITKEQMAESWFRVKEVFAGALRQPPGERESYLDHVCSDDRYLRDEVESLLNSFESADTFLETPPLVDGDSVETFAECFAPGQKVGQYEIIRKLGSGGMGEVYLARDAKLHRPVAIKALYRDLSGSERSKNQLLREARAAATLDHPNICSIYEISEIEGRSFIVMQYIEGETLCEVLENGPLELSDAVEIGIQIAEALEEAHHHKIIHRDIKPGNIIVSRKGLVKVLDFGLAKSLETGSIADSVKHPDTHGTIMGTVPYMSPEQLRGKTLDPRTDIFSLGAVLYEMVTGRRVFRKDNQAESVSAILNDQPELGPVPPAVRFLIQKALMKDKRRRYQSAEELGSDLRGLKDSIRSGSLGRRSIWSWFSGGHARTSPAGSFFSFRRTRETHASNDESYAGPVHSFDDARYDTEQTHKYDGRRNLITVGNALMLSAAAIALVIFGGKLWFTWSDVNRDSHKFDSIRPVRLISWNSGGSSIYRDYSASHNGKMIAFSSNQGGANEGIYIKQTVDGKDIRVTNDQWNDRGPIWSPDDQIIAFASYREGRSGIYSCPAFGGSTTLLKIVGDGDLFIRKWSKDGSAIFYEFNGNLFRLDVNSKEATPVTNFPPVRNETRFAFSVSPDEKEVVYRDKVDGRSDLWLLRLDGGIPSRLTNSTEDEIRPVWHPDGKRILYTVVRDGHYQINQVDTSGDPPEQVTRGSDEYEIIDLSSDGSRIFYLTWQERSDVWSVDTGGHNERQIANGVEFEFWPEASPDGKWLAYQQNDAPYIASSLLGSRIAVRPLNSDGSPIYFNGYNPHWLPDSRTLAFTRWNEDKQKSTFWTVNVGTGEEQRVSDYDIALPSYSVLPYNRSQVGVFSWSPDGRKAIYLSRISGSSNVLETALDTKETVNLTQNNDASVQYYSPLWAREGDRAAFVSYVRASEEKPASWSLWTWDGGSLREVLSTRSSLRLLGWGDNGDLILASSDGPMKASPIDLTLLNVSLRGEKRKIADLSSVYATSLTLSADGQTLAFTLRRDDRDDIWTASAGNGSLAKITSNGSVNTFLGSPSFAPDGKTIYFDKQEKINTISMFENFK